MAKEKEMLRLYFNGLSRREICVALGCGHGRLEKLISGAKGAGVTWEAVKDLDDGSIARLVAPPAETKGQRHAKPDFERLSKELEKNGVTRKLLWYEYCTNISGKNLVPYQYSQFCKMFDEHLEAAKATYRIKHEPGKRMFVDWAGDTGAVIDPLTGAEEKIYVFVACLPYSGLLYAEGFFDMKQAAWTAAHVHALEYYGGAPGIFVPDNAKTASLRAPAYTVLINERYDELAVHYGSAVIPARVRRPRDKALVENGVLIVERSILAPLRNERFFSLGEFNDAVFDRLEAINKAPYQKRPGSRMGIFASEEKHALKPLPNTRFELPEYRTAKAAPDYHVQIDGMRYSVPYRSIGKKCDARLTAANVEIMLEGKTIAIHPRLYGRKGQYSTLPEHMPPNHAAHDASWTPGRYQRWADGIGPNTRLVIDRVLDGKKIVEQAFVPCMNILGLAKRGQKGLLEQACAELAKGIGAPSYSLVRSEERV